MTQETGKAVARRVSDKRFANRFIQGQVIDIGSGDDGINKYRSQFPNIVDVREWDLGDGDAVHLDGVGDNTYDCVHSSHCLEHLTDPVLAMTNWIRVAKPGAYIVVLVPDEDLYEQGVWPSTFNYDHKTSWTVAKLDSWSPVSQGVIPFLFQFLDQVQIVKIELIDHNFTYGVPRQDQTLGTSESAIEFILRKK
jgi:ubiquinone/menaquinone biosynthesis C-methylase UbiE